MLKRIYVHNYQCLVNFEINFDDKITTNLLLGANGSGKTSLLSVLHDLQRFIASSDRLDDKYNPVFEPSTLTRWLNESIQRFELDIKGDTGIYKYHLEIEHSIDKHQSKARVKTEKLYLDTQPLYEFEINDGIGNAKLYNDTRNRKPIDLHSIGWCSSGIGDITERRENTKLTTFKKWFEKLFIVQVIPSAIDADFAREEAYPERNMANFSAWLNYWNNENREGLAKVEESLREIIKGFSSFKFTQSGIKKILDIKLKDKYSLNFNELSDGQKTLAALYTLVYCVPEGSTICIDEPDNFLALPEIQPWLDALQDQYQENNSQALLISHHPSLINFLAPDSGYWFSRQENHSRVERITHKADGGLPLAELVSLGWIYGEY